MTVSLVTVDRPREKKTFYLGPYPNLHFHQNTDVWMFVTAFMWWDICPDTWRRRPEDIEPDMELLSRIRRGRWYGLDWLRWLGDQTLGSKHDFDEAKTEDALMCFLTEPGRRDRGHRWLRWHNLSRGIGY